MVWCNVVSLKLLAVMDGHSCIVFGLQLLMLNHILHLQHTGDWDWWLSSENSLQGRHALVPEVGRTYHAGAAGAHVTGWAQEHDFASMIYNTDPNVMLRDLEEWVNTVVFLDPTVRTFLIFTIACASLICLHYWSCQIQGSFPSSA